MPAEMLSEYSIIAFCLLLGGILKGVTGAGAPIIAIPVLATIFDVRLAIVVMLIPNILTNSWQAWCYRQHLLPSSFVLSLSVGGVVGIFIGTYALTALAPEILAVVVACSVLAYVVMRLTKPEWKILMPLAKKLALPAGVAAGFLQGASGLSAPASITFLNAMGLDRRVFIATISMFFTAITVVQFPALWQAGLLTNHLMIISGLAFLPIALGMLLGQYLAKLINPAMFDRLVLVLLLGIAGKLFWQFLF